MKPKREENKEYSNWIESLPCITPGCGAELNVWHNGRLHNSVGHHLQEKGHGGKATKCSDMRRVPLCHTHHTEIHAGRDSFLEKYNIDGEELIRRLNEIYAK
jgi:hypothetical protein